MIRNGPFAQDQSRQLLESLLSPWQIMRWEPSDFGIDALVEITHRASIAGHQEATGHLFSIQLKASHEPNAPRELPIAVHHLRYWLNHSLPVLLVSTHLPSKTANIQWIDENLLGELRHRSPAFWANSTVIVPLRNEALSVTDKATFETSVLRFRRKELAIPPSRFFELRERVLKAAEELEVVGHQSGVESVKLLVTEVRNSLRASAYTVTIAGPQRVGKSTLINALMGANVSPVADYPTTAVPLLFQAGEKAEAEVIFADGSKKQVQATAEAVRPFAAQQELLTTNEQAVRVVRVSVPNDTLARGISLVDTPGLHDASESVRDVTAEALKMADAVLYVLDAGLGPKFKLGQAEIEDLRHLQSSKERVIIVLNQADMLSDQQRTTLLSYVETQLRKFEIWNGLPIPPLFVSGKDAWSARSTGTRPPDAFLKLEEELWGHLLRHRATGFHRLIAAVTRLDEARDVACAMLSDRAIKGEEAGNLDRARKACESANRRGAQSRKRWELALRNEVRGLLSERSTARIAALQATLEAIPKNGALPNANDIADKLRNELKEDLLFVRALVRERVAALANTHADIVRNALTESRAELGIPKTTAAMHLTMSEIAPIDLSLPEATVGFFGGLVGFLVNPALGAVTTLLGWVWGIGIGAQRRRIRVERECTDRYQKALFNGHHQLIRHVDEWISVAAESIALQSKGRLETFMNDAENRIKRLGAPLKAGEAELLQSTVKKLAEQGQLLNVMTTELARVDAG